jgi:hypothetical protein
MDETEEAKLKKQREGEFLVGQTAADIVHLLHERRFTHYGADEVMKRVQKIIDMATMTLVIKDSEGPVDRFGNLIEPEDKK